MLLTFIEIKARGSQLQGEAKTKTASLVEALYSFDSGRSKHTIQKAVNKTWFNNKRDEGVVYQDYFNPIAIPAIALILTAVSFFFCPVKECFNRLFFLYHLQIECNIDRWATGIKTNITFYAEEYRPIYDSHVFSLNEFGVYSKSHNFDLLGRLQHKCYNFGW